MSKIEVNEIDKQTGSTLTIGGSGTTVQLGTGASQTGFGRTGSVNWQTGSIKTANFTATSGEGYFCNTSGGAFTLTLPSSPSAGDIVGLKDYGSSFAANNLTLGRGGSLLNGNSGDKTLATNNLSLTLVYVDGTEGWVSVEEGTGFVGEGFISATGGTETESGNCKIHTFTGPGTFTVNRVACVAANNIVSYVIVAGGAGGGRDRAGGGGAGGYREVKNPVTPYTASPLDGYPTPANRVTVTAQSYAIAVGGGGAGGNNPAGGDTHKNGVNGSNSSFACITAAGGGGGHSSNTTSPRGGGFSGGSGGGGGGSNPSPSSPPAGAGNTPPVSPPQGNPGGEGQDGPNSRGAGGGGAGAAAANASTTPGAAPGGGAGATSCITGTPTARAGGGGGTGTSPPTGGTGGSGGGGAGGNPAGTAGTANTGGGGGGSCAAVGAAGGSGIVIIRYKFQ